MAGSEQQNAWMLEVLNITISNTAAANGADPEQATGASLDKLLPVWMDAKESTDQGISQLQRALMNTNDPDLMQIAEYGLNGATDRQMTKLVVALREVDGEATPQARATLASAVVSFREFLDGSPITQLIEDNPFGIAIPIRQTLGSALDQIEQRLAV